MAKSNPPFFGQRGSPDPRSQGSEDDDDPVLGLARTVRQEDPFEGIFRARKARPDDLRSLAAEPGPRQPEALSRKARQEPEEPDAYDLRRDERRRYDDDQDDGYDDPRRAAWEHRREEPAWDDREPRYDARHRDRGYAEDPPLYEDEAYEDEAYEDEGHDRDRRGSGHREALRIGQPVEEAPPAKGLAGLFGRKKAAPAEPPPQEWHDDDPEYDDRDDYDDRDAYDDDPRYARGRAEAARDRDYDDEDYDDDYDDYDDDDYDDEPARHPRRRRGGGIIVTAVVSIGVVGAVAFGYWQLTSSGGGGGNGPAVISADTAPTKVVPPEQPDTAEPGTAEREQFTRTAQEPPQPPPIDNTAESADALQPRLVKTYTVRPDGTFMEDRPGLIPNAAQPFASVAQQPAQPMQPAQEPSLQTAAAPDPTPTPIRDGPLPPGTWMVQVLALKSEEDARAGYQKLQQDHPGILGGKEAHIMKAANNYRVRLPMESKEAAVQLCTNLKANSVDCLVRNN